MEGAMKSKEKEFQRARRSASIATLLVIATALVMLGLSLSHGSGNARAETRPVAAVASSGQNDAAIASSETDEMNSARRVPGHSELTLQLD
jgi:uncharacterized membrane protein